MVVHILYAATRRTSKPLARHWDVRDCNKKEEEDEQRQSRIIQVPKEAVGQTAAFVHILLVMKGDRQVCLTPDTRLDSFPSLIG